MKNETKLKIILWVKKRLNYTEAYNPIIKKEKFEVKVIQSNTIMPKTEYEYFMQKDGKLGFVIAQRLAEEIVKSFNYELSIHPDFENDNRIRIEAKMYIATKNY